MKMRNQLAWVAMLLARGIAFLFLVRFGIGDWMTFYNTERPHSTLNYMSPAAYEAMHQTA